jgi:hypothetical protein
MILRGMNTRCQLSKIVGRIFTLLSHNDRRIRQKVMPFSHQSNCSIKHHSGISTVFRTTGLIHTNRHSSQEVTSRTHLEQSKDSTPANQTTHNMVSAGFGGDEITQESTTHSDSTESVDTSPRVCYDLYDVRESRTYQRIREHRRGSWL